MWFLVAMSMSSMIANDSLVWFAWSFAVIYPCRCHHECSLMVWFVPGGGSLFRGSQSFIHEDVIMNVLSWFGSCSFLVRCSWWPCRCHHDSSLFRGSQSFIHVDVIMIVRSWPFSHGVVRSWRWFSHGGVLSWWFAVLQPCRYHQL